MLFSVGKSLFFFGRTGYDRQSHRDKERKKQTGYFDKGVHACDRNWLHLRVASQFANEKSLLICVRQAIPLPLINSGGLETAASCK